MPEAVASAHRPLSPPPAANEPLRQNTVDEQRLLRRRRRRRRRQRRLVCLGFPSIDTQFSLLPLFGCALPSHLRAATVTPFLPSPLRPVWSPTNRKLDRAQRLWTTRRSAPLPGLLCHPCAARTVAFAAPKPRLAAEQIAAIALRPWNHTPIRIGAGAGAEVLDHSKTNRALRSLQNIGLFGFCNQGIWRPQARVYTNTCPDIPLAARQHVRASPFIHYAPA